MAEYETDNINPPIPNALLNKNKRAASNPRGYMKGPMKQNLEIREVIESHFKKQARSKSRRVNAHQTLEVSHQESLLDKKDDISS